MRRIQDAPKEHAEAILAAYDLLQKLHEAGILSLGSGLISAGKTIIEHVAEVANSPQAITALRTALIFGNLLNTLDANELHKAMQVEEKDATIFHIVKGLTTKEARQAAAIGVNVLNVFGKALAKLNAEKP